MARSALWIWHLDPDPSRPLSLQISQLLQPKLQFIPISNQFEAFFDRQNNKCPRNVHKSKKNKKKIIYSLSFCVYSIKIQEIMIIFFLLAVSDYPELWEMLANTIIMNSKWTIKEHFRHQFCQNRFSCRVNLLEKKY